LFTVCPKCALTLVVTAADLRVAQGYVRCGRCSNVFNALARLSEDKGANGAAPSPGAVPPASTAPASTSNGSNGLQPKPAPTDTSATQPQTPAAPTRPPLPTGSFVYTKPENPTSTPRPGPGTTQPPRAPQGASAPAPQGVGGPPTGPTPRPIQQPGTAAPFNPAARPAADMQSNPALHSPLPPAAGAPPKPTPVAPIPAASQRPAHTPFQAPQRTPLHMPSPGTFQAPTPPTASASLATPPPPRSLPIELNLDDDDAIPEDALEFNADADVTQFFVEPPPNPEWTAATGTFKSIVLKSEEPTPPPKPAPGAPKPTVVITPVAAKVDPRNAYPPPAEFNSRFKDDDIELDADFLSATSEMRKLQTGLSDELTLPHEAAPPPRETVSLRHAPPAREAPREPAPLREQPMAAASPSHVAPSARMAPRGAPPVEVPAQTRPRLLAPEIPTRAAPKPAPMELEVDDFPEPEVVSVARAPIRAFGLEPDEPQPESLRSLARSVEATTVVGGIEPLPPERPLLGSATLWTAAAGAMILVLAIQVVNHYRNDLAATPQFNKPITALYSALGIQLTPRWDLHAYDVRQLGASVDAANAGEIMVRASVKNGARQAQPMPLLRVTLQDRYGNRIAARDVPPGNYLPRATASIGYLPAGQRIDAEMAFVDPGSNAVGFEIDACLPAPAGGIACANDPVSR
jgi:predicted Zn finger-like uncharacterized protein